MLRDKVPKWNRHSVLIIDYQYRWWYRSVGLTYIVHSKTWPFHEDVRDQRSFGGQVHYLSHMEALLLDQLIDQEEEGRQLGRTLLGVTKKANLLQILILLKNMLAKKGVSR